MLSWLEKKVDYLANMDKKFPNLTYARMVERAVSNVKQFWDF